MRTTSTKLDALGNPVEVGDFIMTIRKPTSGFMLGTVLSISNKTLEFNSILKGSWRASLSSVLKLDKCSVPYFEYHLLGDRYRIPCLKAEEELVLAQASEIEDRYKKYGFDNHVRYYTDRINKYLVV